MVGARQANCIIDVTPSRSNALVLHHAGRDRPVHGRPCHSSPECFLALPCPGGGLLDLEGGRLVILCSDPIPLIGIENDFHTFPFWPYRAEEWYPATGRTSRPFRRGCTGSRSPRTGRC